MKKLSLNLILITTALFLCTQIVQAAQNSEATVHIDVDTTEGGIQISRNVAVGEIFDVDIVINGAVNLKIFNLVVTFPQALLEIQEDGVTQGGDLFPTLGFFEREFGTPGKVEVTGGVMSDDDAKSGDGVLFHLRFKALSDGQANLQFLAADTQVLFDNSSGFDDPVLLENSDDGMVYIGDVVDPDQSTVEATSPVPVGETSTITITAKDAYGNPIPGIPAVNIVVSSTGTDYTITPPATATDASGQTTATISSTKAEEKIISVTINSTAITNTASVTFTAGGVAPGQSTVDATTPVPVGGTSTITITAKDAYGNPIPGIPAASIEVSSSGTDYTITPPAIPTNASGQTTATISSTKAETKTISVTINGTAIGTAPVTFTPGDVDAGQSTVVATTPVPVGGTSTITITAKDANGNPIPGISAASIEVSSSGTDYTITPPATATNASGQTTATISSTVAEEKTISVTINGTAIGTAPVTFTPGGVSTAQSSVEATTPVQVGGTSTITITAKDAYGNPIPGIPAVNIVVSSTGTANTIAQPTTATDASGQTTATISSTKAEEKIISVTVDGTAIGTASVEFTAGDPFKLDFTTSPGETAATAVLSPSPQVTVLDKYGNLVTSTVPVNLVITDDTGTPGALLSYTTPVDTVDGVATFDNLTIDLAGTGYRLTAKSGTLASDDSELFDITADPVLTIEKSGDPDPVDPDETVEYKITYGNTGLDNANNIIIVETLPANLTYVSSTDGGVYDEATGTITWTIDSLAALTTGKAVYFTAQVSDSMLEGGTIINSNLTIDCDETEPVGQIVPETTTVNDKKAPATSGYIPEPDSIQVARDTIIQLHITDGGSGVRYDGGTVKIYVEGDLIYDGSNETSDGVYDSTGKDQAVKGICRRVGTEADYMFVFQSSTQFDYEQQVDVAVSAEDEAGNILSGEPYHFHTVMRSFGPNIKVNSDTGSLVQNNPATARDSDGNIWVVWDQTNAAGDTDIYIGMLPDGEDTFEESKLVFGGPNNQSNPAIAIDKSDTIGVVWQSYDPDSLWDIYGSYASASDNGTNWSEPIKISTDDDNNKSNQTSPAIAYDGTSQGYVAWEDDRTGEKDIWGWTSGDPILILKGEGDETEPFVIAHPVLNKAWVISTTDISAEKATDLFFAPFDSPGSYQKIVQTNSNQSSPVCAISDDGVIHLLWVDDENDDGDIFYGNDASGLPIQGTSIVDEPDTVQSSPAIAVNGTKIFACWQDERNVADNNADIDIYYAESGSDFGTNILINDDLGANRQAAPVIGIDKNGNPYMVWVDNRLGNNDIYGVATTSVGKTLKSKTVLASDTDTQFVQINETSDGVDAEDDVIVEIPAGALSVDTMVSISEIANLPELPPGGFGVCYNFGPSGLEFNKPVTITIPHATEDCPGHSVYNVYWYDPSILPPASPWTQDGITDVEHLTLPSGIHVIRFNTTHFTVFDTGGFTSDIVSGGGGGGGGCAMSPHGQGNVAEFLLPYIGFVVILLVITWVDARRRRTKCNS